MLFLHDEVFLIKLNGNLKMKYILYINIFNQYILIFEAISTLVMTYLYIKIFSWGKLKYKCMYIHPEAWDMFGDGSLSAVQPEKEEISAELSADTVDHIVYNIVY